MKVLNYATLADENEELRHRLRYAEEERDTVAKCMIRLEQDFGASLADLKKSDLECDFCAYNSKHAPCDAADYDCSICKEDCTCKTCRDNSKWAWKGRAQ